MQTFISVDVETDGPIPGRHSMLALGAVALNAQGEELSSFYCNFEPLPLGQPDSKTMAFWAKHAEAYAKLHENRLHPGEATRRFRRWVEQFENPVFVGYPAGFDWLFTYWYLIMYTYGSPFSHSQMLDIKTLLWAASGKGDVRAVSKRRLKGLIPNLFHGFGRHTHYALDDAREQGQLFMRVQALCTDVDAQSTVVNQQPA